MEYFLYYIRKRKLQHLSWQNATRFQKELSIETSRLCVKQGFLYRLPRELAEESASWMAIAWTGLF